MSNNSVKFLQFFTGNVIGLFPADDKAGFSRFIDNCWLIHDLVLVGCCWSLGSVTSRVVRRAYFFLGLVLLYCRLNLDQFSLEHPCWLVNSKAATKLICCAVFYGLVLPYCKLNLDQFSLEHPCWLVYFKAVSKLVCCSLLWFVLLFVLPKFLLIGGLDVYHQHIN
jgi:hypothetical protein